MPPSGNRDGVDEQRLARCGGKVLYPNGVVSTDGEVRLGKGRCLSKRVGYQWGPLTS
jgi:hypothetical protein